MLLKLKILILCMIMQSFNMSVEIIPVNLVNLHSENYYLLHVIIFFLATYSSFDLVCTERIVFGQRT